MVDSVKDRPRDLDLNTASVFNDATSLMAKDLRKKPDLWSAQDSQTKLLNDLEEAKDTEVSDPVLRVAKMAEGMAQEEVERKRLEESNAEIQKLNAELEGQALIDHLTGMPNMRYFDSQIEKDVALADRDGLPLGLAMIDLNNFKGVNDTYGHQAGDETLRIVGQAIASVMRETDFLARYGGDELVLIMPLLKNKEEFFGDEETYQHILGDKSIFLRINEKIGELIISSRDKFPSDFKWDPGLEVGGVPIYLSAGIGILEKSKDHHNLPELQKKLLADADMEMYKFKKQRDSNRKS